MKDINDVLDKLKLTSLIKSLPKGLDTELISEGKQVNSSTVQKILLARCIILKPKILFLEEPTDKLDKETAKEIIDVLTNENNPWTLVVVAKGNYWKTKCKTIYTLENGSIKPIK